MKVASVGGSAQAGSEAWCASHFHVVQRVVLVMLGATNVQRLKRCGLLKGVRPISEVANPVHSVETFARLL